jgi:hypothetical protein
MGVGFVRNEDCCCDVCVVYQLPATDKIASSSSTKANEVFVALEHIRQARATRQAGEMKKGEEHEGVVREPGESEETVGKW